MGTNTTPSQKKCKWCGDETAEWEAFNGGSFTGYACDSCIDERGEDLGRKWNFNKIHN